MRLIYPPLGGAGGNTYNITGLIPPTYTVYRDGATYYAATSVAGLSNYSGAAFHTVVNSAIGALAGGHIYIAPGAYVQTGSININDYTTLEADPRAVMTLANTTNTPSIYINNKTRFQIIGGEWDGNGVNQTHTSTNSSIILYTQCSDFKILGVHVHNSAYCGIDMDNATRGLIQGCDSHDNLEASIVGQRSNNMIINSNYVHDNATKGGIYMYTDNGAWTTSNNIISNNRCYNTYTSGISISLRQVGDTGINNSIVGNTCIQCGTQGGEPSINLGYSGTVVAEHNSIVGNTVHTTAGHGIRMTGNYNVIANNTVHHTLQDCIEIYQGSTHNVISGNTVSDNANSHGISLLDASYNIIMGNNVYHCANKGICFIKDATGSSYNVVAHNMVDASVGGQLYIYAGCNYNMIRGNYFSSAVTDNGTGTIQADNTGY
jgi:parallel beta-helix repeat protein